MLPSCWQGRTYQCGSLLIHQPQGRINNSLLEAWVVSEQHRMRRLTSLVTTRAPVNQTAREQLPTPSLWESDELGFVISAYIRHSLIKLPLLHWFIKSHPRDHITEIHDSQYPILKAPAWQGGRDPETNFSLGQPWHHSRGTQARHSGSLWKETALPTSTTTLAPDAEPGPLLALAPCQSEALPGSRGKEGVVQSGSAAHRWSDRLLWNPAQARTQRQRLRAAVSQSSQSTPGPSPQPLPWAQAQRRGGGAGTGEGRAASQRLQATPSNVSERGMWSRLEEDGWHCFHRGASWENPGCLPWHLNQEHGSHTSMQVFSPL